VEVIAAAETAADGILALRRHSATWRLAVVDMFLKEGNGLDVLRSGRARGPHQHMLVLTNYATPEIRKRSIEAGADAVFDKSTEIDLFFDQCKAYSNEQES
jgi:DNA-binding NarL/FixJ family response regulator